MESCPVCSKPAPLKCSACHGVSYCSTDHQKEHWKIHKKSCSKFRISKESEFGQGLVAATDLKGGEVVLIEKAILVTSCSDVLVKVQPTCVACGCSGNCKMSGWEGPSCSKCFWPVCGPRCAKLRIHADNECQIFASKNYKFPGSPVKPDNVQWVIMLIRALMLKKRDPKSFEKILELQSDFSIPGAIYSWEVETRITQALLDISAGGGEFEELKKLLRIFQINNFTLKKMDEDGWNSTNYLFLKMSRLNHSCAPNCLMDISWKDGYKAKLCTAVPVKKGEELTLSYFWIDNSYKGTVERQLCTPTKYFNCKCRRCMDPTELGTYSSAIRCEACRDRDTGIPGYLLPCYPLDMTGSARWNCNRCDNFKTASDVSSSIEPVYKLVSQTTSKLVENWDEAGLIKFYNKVMEKYSGEFLHPNHSILQQMTKEVFDLLARSAKGPVNFNTRQFYVKCGMYLLAIQNIVSPGCSRARAYLLEEIAFSVNHQTCELLNLKRCNEVIQNFRIFEEFTAEVLTHLRTFFPDFTTDKIKSIEHNVRKAAHNKSSIMSRLFQD